METTGGLWKKAGMALKKIDASSSAGNAGYVFLTLDHILDHMQKKRFQFTGRIFVKSKSHMKLP